MNSYLHDYNAKQLQRLDLLLHREILRLRANYQLSLDEFRGLYVSDEQVDTLVNQALAPNPDIRDINDLTDQANGLQHIQSSKRPEQWNYIANEFDLTAFELEILLLALAPEMHLKYETLYGYLNNDITRKYPTIDLALRVCCDTSLQQQELRTALAPQGTLITHGLLETVSGNNTDQRSSLAAGFRPAPIVVNYLTGVALGDPGLTGIVKQYPVETDQANTAPLTAKITARLKQIAILFRPGISPDFIILEVVQGSGKSHAARYLCTKLGLSLIEADTSLLTNGDGNHLDLLSRLLLQARLHKAGVLLNACEELMQGDPAARRTLKHMLPLLAAVPMPVILNVPPQTPWRELLKGYRVVNLNIPEPDTVERLKLWDFYLRTPKLTTTDADIDALAERFILTSEQIQDAVNAAEMERVFKVNGDDYSNRDYLFKAARDQSIGEIGKLAQKVTLRFSWDDLILPRPTLKRVKDVTAAIRHRNKVYQEWGMARRVHNANGLMVLFSGASGTGKTLTASVIAKDIGLHLYRIDLAGIVSKYIGETEKNLDRIFSAARRANAIIFFDEADALFGKRSEVKDAHDRYANIEIAYLLQKMEEHDGVVILATNLSKNMDQAFSRRMHYVVEFPKPGEEHRERLWRGMFPSDTPVTEDVDFTFLAKQFDNTGGDIKNIALDAAFLAAENGQMVTMEQLIKAMGRQMLKQGKVPSAVDFKQYHRLIGL